VALAVVVVAAAVVLGAVVLGVVVVGVVLGVVVVGVVVMGGTAGADGAFLNCLTAWPRLRPSAVIAVCRSTKLSPWFVDALSAARNCP
jgi:hypothetical protein